MTLRQKIYKIIHSAFGYCLQEKTGKPCAFDSEIDALVKLFEKEIAKRK